MIETIDPTIEPRQNRIAEVTRKYTRTTDDELEVLVNDLMDSLFGGFDDGTTAQNLRVVNGVHRSGPGLSAPASHLGGA